jgi:hypothetical protein
VVNSSPTSLPKDNAAENFMLPASYQIQETVGSQQLKPTEMAKETEQLATHSEPQEEIETVRETEQQLLHSLQEESKKAEQLATHSEPQEETEAVRETEQQLLHSVLQEESEKAEQLATHSEPQEEAEAVTETEQQLLHSVPQEGSEQAEEAEQLAVYSELQIETEIPAGLKQQTEIQQYSEVSESQGETQTPERSGQHQEHIEGMQETESQCDMFGQFHDELKDVEEELCIQVFRPQGMPFGFSMAGGAGSASVSGIQQVGFICIAVEMHPYILISCSVDYQICFRNNRNKKLTQERFYSHLILFDLQINRRMQCRRLSACGI